MARLATALVVEPSAAGARLDRWLVERVGGLSRARLQALVETGRVRVDGVARKAAHRLRGGETVEVEIPPPRPDALEPEAIDLVVVHEDDHVLVVDKPAGMVVHPGAGHARGTLAAAVLAHAPTVAGVGGRGRPGIVHRLDKGTSGLLVLAKTSLAYESLTKQLAGRTVRRTYLAVVHGRLASDAGTIDAPIGRHPRHRVRMAVRPPSRGRPAVTRYRVLERLPGFTVLEARLQTGRTHQIRVHLASLGHPVAGDETYGPGRRRPGQELLSGLEGLALHAASLGLIHPFTRKSMEFVSPIPRRIEAFLWRLRHTGGASVPGM